MDPGIVRKNTQKNPKKPPEKQHVKRTFSTKNFNLFNESHLSLHIAQTRISHKNLLRSIFSVYSHLTSRTISEKK